MIVYLETNFLMGIATGREPHAGDLMAIPETELRIVLPDVCIMEAFSALNHLRTASERFRVELDRQIAELRRDHGSEWARSMLAGLEQARAASAPAFSDVETRLLLAVQEITARPDFELMPVGWQVVEEFFRMMTIPDPTDDLILAAILHHARGLGVGQLKAMVSGNRRDFGEGLAHEMLAEAGVRYFTRTEAFLGWLRAGAAPPDAGPA